MTMRKLSGVALCDSLFQLNDQPGALAAGLSDLCGGYRVAVALARKACDAGLPDGHGRDAH